VFDVILGRQHLLDDVMIRALVVLVAATTRFGHCARDCANVPVVIVVIVIILLFFCFLPFLVAFSPFEDFVCV